MKIQSPNKVYFVSDTHFGHENVIKYSKRPFESLHLMNKTLTENWNAVVQPTDDVFHLGDFAMKMNSKDIANVVRRLNGRIHLIMGNHDKVIKKDLQLQKMFASIQDVLEISVKDDDAHGGWQPIFMSHYPHISWNRSHYGSWHLHGHCHGSLGKDNQKLRAMLECMRIMDAGVDATEQPYYPVSYQCVKTVMNSKNWKPIDRHGTKDE